VRRNLSNSQKTVKIKIFCKIDKVTKINHGTSQKPSDTAEISPAHIHTKLAQIQKYIPTAKREKKRGMEIKIMALIKTSIKRYYLDRETK
jgi:hypothetical protein